MNIFALIIQKPLVVIRWQVLNQTVALVLVLAEKQVVRINQFTMNI